MPEPFNKQTVADMAEAAVREIENLRAQIASLEPKAHAYDNLSIVLRLVPQQPGGASVDMAWRLRRYIEELRAAPETEDGA